MLLFLLFISKNINKLGYRFMLGYLVVLPFFLVIMGYKLSGHSYHQFPVAPAIIFFIAYFLIVITTNLLAAIKVKHIAARMIIILLLVFALPLPGSSLYSKSFESRDRMFNTQFPGLDIAGDYIREHSSPDERVLHSSGQSFGVLWHAARKGYKPQGDVKDFIRAEQEYNVNWVFVYQWGMQKYFQEQNTSEYLKSNYRLVQFGFIPQNDQQIQPLFFLFRKGGNFSDSQFNTMVQEALSKNMLFTKPYEYTTGSYEVKFINFE
jgi:hypothetical protein